MKKKRKVYRIRYKKKSSYRRITSRQKDKPEVKVYMAAANDVQISAIKSASSFDLNGVYNITPDIIGNIAIGTAQTQRIGQHVFVKKIIFDIWGDICPKVVATPATNINCNTSLIRYIVDNQRATAGASIANYFRQAMVYATAGLPDRRVLGVHKDVTKEVTVGYPAQWTSSAAVIGLGRTFKHHMTFNLNRRVTFDANNGAMKNDSDVYSLKVMGYIPNMAPSTQYQSHCINYRYRIYYTDD